MRKFLPPSLLFAGCLMLVPHARAAGEVKAVATFSILGNLVQEIAGDRVQLKVLVGPGGDGHVFQPSPSHARLVSQAAVLFSNGLGFEPWIGRLLDASGFQGAHVVASDGVEPLKNAHGGHDHHHGHEHGAVDPHAWQSVRNVKIYARNIANALCSADAAGCEVYRRNEQAYQAKLDDLDAGIRAAWAKVPAGQRKVITSHDAFGYYAREYGVTFRAAQGISTAAEATPGDIARLVRQIQQENIQALFVESISDPRLVEQIGRETGVRPAGELFSDSLSKAAGPAATDQDLMRFNTRALVQAAGGTPPEPAMPAPRK
jgi:zinc/manganese transport system substrate-binding protein